MIKKILVCDLCGRPIDTDTCFSTDLKGLKHLCIPCGVGLCDSPICDKDEIVTIDTKSILEEDLKVNEK